MFGELLKKYRLKKGFKQSDLAERINELLGTEIKSVNVSSWEKGTNPKIEIIESIADILEIPVQYLFDDTDIALNRIIEDKLPSFSDMKSHTTKVQLYDGLCGAGSGGILYNTTNEFMYIDSILINKKYRDRPVVALKIVGDSMKPYIDEGDIVLVNIINDSFEKPTIDGKYVINTIAGTMLKNLSFRANGDIVISSCNKAYPSETIKAHESQEYLEIIGVAVGRLLKN